MDIHLDTSWCPVCSREIMPKRFIVPAPPPPPQAPAAPPSSPSSSPSKVQPAEAAPAKTTRTKSGNVRAKGGLAHGTGRVKPNGAVKRSTSNLKVTAAAPPAPTQQQPAPTTRSRTVIDQGPIPLYCSDECKMADLNCLNGMLTIDHDPARESQFTPAVPHNSYTNLSAARNEVDSDGSSDSSISWSSDSTKASNLSPSIATLAAIYDFPPMPPPAPILEYSDSQSSSSESEHNFDLYQSGVMMAARRIKDALCPEAPPKRSMSAFASTAAPQTAPRGPIPGWTDGSDAWRSAVYSLSSPQHKAKYHGDEKPLKAYKSSVASPHRSRGVNSTMGDATATPINNSSTGSLPAQRPSAVAPTRSASFAEDIYSKYPLSFSRRSESRMNLHNSPSSLPASSSSSAHSNSRRRQEKNILKAGAEGKLLVPDVKLKVSGGSSLSLSTACMSESSSRRSMKSPLSRHGSDLSETTMSETSTQTSSSLPRTQRPTPETRSWSYDNLMTYPVMTPAPKKEKRIEKQIVDGQLKEVVVEVELEQPFKKLFLFPGKQSSI